MTKDQALKLALEALEKCRTYHQQEWSIEETTKPEVKQAIIAIKEALANVATEDTSKERVDEMQKQRHEQEPVTVLPDGSAFAVMSYPLPKDHWLYQERQYNDGEYEPVELGKPVLTHEMRDAVVSAVRYAIRGATNCGKEVDFDPDALVQNAVYALCGPYTTPPHQKPLTDEEIDAVTDLQWAKGVNKPIYAAHRAYARAIEAAHGIKEKNGA